MTFRRTKTFFRSEILHWSAAARAAGNGTVAVLSLSDLSSDRADGPLVSTSEAIFRGDFSHIHVCSGVSVCRLRHVFSERYPGSKGLPYEHTKVASQFPVPLHPVAQSVQLDDL